MDFERYLNIRTAAYPAFSPDGERVAFLMDVTGTYQVWQVPVGGGWPEQLTFYDERVMSVDYSPTHDHMVFAMDAGGNERTQLYLLSGDGHSIEPLVYDPDVIHSWGGWSPDGKRFAFSANRRSFANFDVYVQALGSDEAELVFEGEGFTFVRGFSPDGTKLLAYKMKSSKDSDIYMIDLESGEATHITPHEGNASHDSPAWGPDGVYFVSDLGRDRLAVERVDAETLAREVIEEDAEWEIEAVAFSANQRWRFTLLNEGGCGRLRATDLQTGTTIAPEGLPEGFPNLYVSSYPTHADTLALTFTGPRHNANVWLWNLAENRSVQLTQASLAGIPQKSFKAPERVSFESFDGETIHGWLTLPEGVENPPVIFDVHGGPEGQRVATFNPLVQYYVSAGYAVFEPNVRGSSGYGKRYMNLDDVRKRMDSVADLKACVDYLRGRGGVDVDRIAITGGSYGGFMVLGAITSYPDLWAAAVDIVGIANFVTFLENTGDYRRSHREAEYGSLAHDRDFLESISPIHKVDQITAPLFVIHGANDPRVPVGEARQIAEALESRGVPVELLIYEDEGHGLSKRKNRLDAYPKVVAFLDKHLKG